MAIHDGRVPGIFVIGTDTDVGKTWVSALIIREARSSGISAGGCKPVCSGAQETDGGTVWQDIEALFEAAGGEFDRDLICPQTFAAPFAPPVAARLESRQVNSGLLRESVRRWDGCVDLLVTEGVGGLMCPLTESEVVADLARDLGYPVILVAHQRLGVINHTLLTIEVAQGFGLRLAGIVLNDGLLPIESELRRTNEQEIAARTSVPFLGSVAAMGDRLLVNGRAASVDWLALAKGQSS